MGESEHYQGAEPSQTLPPWPDRLLIMPDSDEYVVVRADKLEQLAENRISWAMEGLLACLALAGGAFVGAIVGLFHWPLDIDGFVNCILFVIGVVGAIIFGCIWFNRRKRFDDVMKQIKAGPKYSAKGKGLERIDEQDGQAKDT